MISRTGTVLVVDDQPDEGARVLANTLTDAGLKCLVLHPSEVAAGHLAQSDLVLVDYQLDEWPSRDDEGRELSLRPLDGLALISILRRHATQLEKPAPSAFAILTGRMATLADPLPPINREHILSSIIGLEWVFSKKEVDIAHRISILANAIRALPNAWSDSGQDELCSLLAVDQVKEDWRAQMLEDASRCLPPVHELSGWSHGLAFVRWLLHRILPYPTFLIGPVHLAARLSVDASQLGHLLSDEKGKLRRALRSCEYTGILKDFSGPRWWRVSVEAFLWEKTDGSSFDRTAIHRVLSKASKVDLAPSVPEVDPLVCYNQHFQPQTKFSSIENAVRIRPDDWPAFADDAWTTIAQARDEHTLSAVVVRDDVAKVVGNINE